MKYRYTITFTDDSGKRHDSQRQMVITQAISWLKELITGRAKEVTIRRHLKV